MDDRSLGLGGVPAVASDGGSSTNTRSTDVLPEKQPALDGASRQAQDADASLEAGTSADFSKASGSAVKKDLQKCATFPSSAGEAGQEDSCCDEDADAPKDSHAYQRSVSLPPPVKLISAMKGSREKNGLPSPRENPHIKWAEDVCACQTRRRRSWHLHWYGSSGRSRRTGCRVLGLRHRQQPRRQMREQLPA